MGLLIQRSKAEVRILYHRDKEEHMRKEENCNMDHTDKETFRNILVDWEEPEEVDNKWHSYGWQFLVALRNP